MDQEELKTEEFIDEPITVEHDAGQSWPKAFVWQKKRYEIVELVETWQDWHTPPYAQHARSWKNRRHRNYYTVRTADGQVFVIYLDRGSGRRDWVLSRRIKG